MVVKYRINQRSYDWSLDINLVTNYPDWWTVQTYEKEPKTSTIKKDIKLAIRAIEIYSKSIKIELPTVEKAIEV